jgi:pimeloyl-ACP methyl ester carboxylesterase
LTLGPQKAFLVASGSLLDRADNSPMLVVNGANDYFVPQADTLVVQGRRNTEVHLIPDIGHCGVFGGRRRCRK